MTDVDQVPAVRVGVALSPHVDDPGGWLADGAAYEAAGAHALWVDPDTGPGLDPLTLTAALAAVTYRALLVTPLARHAPDTIATLARLSRGRLALLAARPAGPDDAEDDGGLVGTVVRRTGPDTFEAVRGADTAEPQRWLAVRTPDGRAAWRAALAAAADGGFHGLVVPTGPNLLDILRNPDEPGERRDLQLAVG